MCMYYYYCYDYLHKVGFCLSICHLSIGKSSWYNLAAHLHKHGGEHETELRLLMHLYTIHPHLLATIATVIKTDIFQIDFFCTCCPNWLPKHDLSVM